MIRRLEIRESDTVVVRPRDEARAQALFDREAVAYQNVYRMEGTP